MGPPAAFANCSSASGALPSTVASAPAASAASRLRASISTTMEPFQIQQILRVRHRHVVGIAAVAIDAERVRLDDAHVLVAAHTRRAFAAAEPGVDQGHVTHLEVALVRGADVGPECHDFADRLVPHRARQRHAAVLQRQRLAAVAEIIAALPDVKVAVADAGGLHLDQYLRARRLRRLLIHLFQRCIELGDLKTLHRFSPVRGRRDRRRRLAHRHDLGGAARSMTPATPGDRERLFQRTGLCRPKRRHKITQFSRTMLN
jgi:hypothetical protein